MKQRHISTSYTDFYSSKKWKEITYNPDNIENEQNKGNIGHEKNGSSVIRSMNRLNNSYLKEQFNDIFIPKVRQFVDPKEEMKKVILRGKSKNYSLLKQFDIEKLQEEGNKSLIDKSKLRISIY